MKLPMIYTFHQNVSTQVELGEVIVIAHHLARLLHSNGASTLVARNNVRTRTWVLLPRFPEQYGAGYGAPTHCMGPRTVDNHLSDQFFFMKKTI